VLLLTGCSAAQEESRIAALVELDATVASFSVCHGSNCSVRTPIGLTGGEWAQIAALFEPPADDAVAEREQIARAIGLMEAIVGPKTNTMRDAGRNHISADQSTQMDCVDESVNTTTYLRLLDQADLLQWHRVGWPAHRRRGLIDFHNTAVILSETDGSYWTVDSWFGPNGATPALVPLETWRAGWEPQQGTTVMTPAVTTAQP
jgi:hypothetical protein